MLRGAVFIIHTDLVKNVVFHNFARQIPHIQYSGRSKQAWAFSEIVSKKIFQNHLHGPASSHFCNASCVECLNEELRFNIIKNLLCLFII